VDVNERSYQVVLISVRDADLFERYQTAVAQVALEYGGIERQLLPQQVYADGVQRPDIVNIVYGHSPDYLQRLDADPRFQAVVSMRSNSIDMISITGTSDRATVSNEGLADRLYLMELARFGPGGEAAYRAYEREAEDFVAPFGHHVERVIRPDGIGDGLPFRPDVIKIAYFADGAAMDRMHADPGHARIEGELYTAAVAESVWFVARARAVAPHGSTATVSATS
jgi:uncharacterized protein (DUF1330 family)